MGDTSGFYQLYLIPGMLHCGGGAGPGNVEWLKVLDAWVTEDWSPAALVATGAGGASQTLCPYPAVAKADGRGARAVPPRSARAE
jgi:feruloyl esterase